MIKTIGIVGSGTMGQSIATAFVMYGYQVRVFDTDINRLSSVNGMVMNDLFFLADEGLIDRANVDGLFQNLKTIRFLEEAVQGCEYIIEAVPEIMELKQNLLGELDKLCDAETILASNTSSLPLEEMMIHLSPERKKRTMVCHWFNPAHLVPLAELSYFGNMDQPVFDEVAELYRTIGKKPVKILKDVAGLVANRIQQAIAREVFSLIGRDVASAEDIDRALKFGPAFRYATTGQLEISDFGGLDIWATVGDNLLDDMDNSKKASPILKTKIEQGKLGFKTGEGFFSYPTLKRQLIKEAYYKKLVVQLKASQNY